MSMVSIGSQSSILDKTKLSTSYILLHTLSLYEACFIIIQYASLPFNSMNLEQQLKIW